MKKEFLSFLLALVIIISLVPVTSVAAISPENNRSNDEDYLTFTATGGAVKIELNPTGIPASIKNINLEYQTKASIEAPWPGSWTTYGEISNSITLCNLESGNSIRLRAPSGLTNAAFGYEMGAYWAFSMTTEDGGEELRQAEILHHCLMEIRLFQHSEITHLPEHLLIAIC